jgi:hypothetical protein
MLIRKNYYQKNCKSLNKLLEKQNSQKIICFVGSWHVIENLYGEDVSTRWVCVVVAPDFFQGVFANQFF